MVHYSLEDACIVFIANWLCSKYEEHAGSTYPYRGKVINYLKEKHKGKFKYSLYKRKEVDKTSPELLHLSKEYGIELQLLPTTFDIAVDVRKETNFIMYRDSEKQELVPIFTKAHYLSM